MSKSFAFLFKIDRIKLRRLMDIEGKRILVIDDEPILCSTMADYLEDYGVDPYTANNGLIGLEIYKNVKPDLVILDLNMPVMDGFEVLSKVGDELKETPFIVVSGVGVVQEAIKAVRLGAWDFVTKPIHDYAILDHAMEKAFDRARLIRENRLYKEHLESEVRKRTKDLRDEIKERKKAQIALEELNVEIEHTQSEIIELLGEVVETRSKETANHVKRVAEFSYLMALEYGMDEEEAELLRKASPMHDVGKIGIPDNILNKPGKLTDDEYETIKTHTIIGYELLHHSERDVLKAASIVALQHHERWDGRGYPNKLEKEDIHIYGRITSIADVFDALSHKRHYKDAWSVDQTYDFIAEHKGSMFDPHLVEMFIGIRDKVEAIYKEYPDERS